MIKDAVQVLKEYWGFSEFRGSQALIIDSVMAGKDVLALLPTGGGKSVCYQVPSLMSDGICIVVSPLIALIQDQVAALKKKGIKAVALTGGITMDEVSDLLDNCVFGNYKFLYLSPERLQHEIVQQRIEQMQVNLIAIDEAHCISQWGNDFRPAYLNCAVLRDIKPGVPVIALTATATSKVADDIVSNLRFIKPVIFKDSFSRDNIVYSVLWEEDKNYRLLQKCRENRRSGIVYVRTRRAAEELAALLNRHQIPAAYFHGGISRAEKETKLKKWLKNEYGIMIATNAFGMGVDKPDVSLVLHYHIPESIENYYQEAGRAGRDGQAADAILVINRNDEIQVEAQFLKVLPDVPFLKLLYNKLNNYFQVPYGEGSNETFQFHLNEFCDAYKLNPILTYNGLQLLDQNSVIALSPAFSQHTTVKFLAGKNELLRYLENHGSIAAAVQVILRTYGGLFDFDTKVNTLLLSRKSGIPENQVQLILEQLQKDGIIDYKARPRDLELTFLVPREDDLTINAFAPKIKDYQQLKKDNVASMLAYIANDRDCRNRQLLRYFGEAVPEDCGSCDVCKSKTTAGRDLREKIGSSILALLAERHYTSRRLIEVLPYGEQAILKVLQELLEDRNIAVNTKNEYTLY